LDTHMASVNRYSNTRTKSLRGLWTL